MTDEGFQMPKSSYEELADIIVAYAHLDGPSGLEQVANLGGMSTTTVSRNNGFLVSTGIVESGQKKSPTSLGKDLGNALHHGVDEEISRYWRDVIDQTDFLEKMFTSVKIRKGMERSSLQSHIAYSAGERKTSRVMTGAATIIEILERSGLVEEEDGTLVVSEVEEYPDEPHEQRRPTGLGRQPREKRADEGELVSRRITLGNIELNINVHIDSSVEELDQLGERLRGVIEELRDLQTSDDDDQAET